MSSAHRTYFPLRLALVAILTLGFPVTALAENTESAPLTTEGAADPLADEEPLDPLLDEEELLPIVGGPTGTAALSGITADRVAQARIIPAAFSAATTQAIDEYIAQGLEEAHIPGAAVTIVSADDVLFSKAYGDCASTDTAFVLASLSKSFTALCLMQLVEAGLVSLDALVSTYLPDCPVGDSITVRQLANQTSGLGYFQNLTNLTVTESAGTFEYSNANYDLLGLIIEAASGMSYADYLKANVFVPLNMRHSFASLADAEASGMAPGHQSYFGFNIPVLIDDPHPGSWAQIPSGYLKSSAGDMGRYLQMYLRGGEGLVSPAGINAVFFDGSPNNIDTNYGMGWFWYGIEDDDVLCHSGLVENYQSYMLVLPERGLAMVVLADTNDPVVGNALMDEIENGVFSFMLGAEPEPVESTYWKMHGLTTMLYLGGIALCALPLIFFKRYRNRLRSLVDDGRWILAITILLALHVMLPAGLAYVPIYSGSTWFELIGYMPDAALVLMLCLTLLLIGGLIALIDLLRHRYAL
ncbi:MAG: serine hydrolase domain-containing protein [Raoultibacter sp.]